MKYLIYVNTSKVCAWCNFDPVAAIRTLWQNVFGIIYYTSFNNLFILKNHKSKFLLTLHNTELDGVQSCHPVFLI